HDEIYVDMSDPVSACTQIGRNVIARLVAPYLGADDRDRFRRPQDRTQARVVIDHELRPLTHAADVLTSSTSRQGSAGRRTRRATAGCLPRATAPRGRGARLPRWDA